jgi:ectoine hydroxylase-related dioxygenase (phytanoyl-CoA dioxygenase family)
VSIAESEVLHGELPPMRTSLDEAQADLEEYGVTRISEALNPTELAGLRTRVEEQAAAEKAAGISFQDGGGTNQRVWNLVSKGHEFTDLLEHPIVTTLARRVLDGDYALSSHTANITGPGGTAMIPHSDQGYAPRDVPFPIAVNFIWMISDFTAENGATMVAPGSHRLQREPTVADMPSMVPGTGPAGSVMVFDARMWHGTGANVSRDQHRCGVLTYFCRPWVRPQENYTLSTVPEVLDEASPQLAQLLGTRVWRTLGGTQGPWGTGTPDELGYRTQRIIGRDEPLIGEMRP